MIKLTTFLAGLVVLSVAAEAREVVLGEASNCHAKSPEGNAGAGPSY
jgi:hypothetical protein